MPGSWQRYYEGWREVTLEPIAISRLLGLRIWNYPGAGPSVSAIRAPRIPWGLGSPVVVSRAV
jgi:hypothetical protein